MESMGFNPKPLLVICIIFLGISAFVLGILAEFKKPAFGTPIPGKDVVVCNYPKDPSVALGTLSAVSVLISTVVGVIAVHFPYEGKSVPSKALLSSQAIKIFYYGAILLTASGAGTTLFNAANEGLLRVHNVHEEVEYGCPTAKTGVFGGAAFLSLDASLFWLVCLMLVANNREDFFDGDVEDKGGEYGRLANS
ncbi:hypothetical protein HPP92_017404 [Vanilla planifolia]|uniref:Uncharacterized protein n=1 Tax=Vanilla planifolia TaxID=51239 RepID=A0A835QC64_VANPL|nr:hypothetical protein HPP92_017404 [Vanilla planifolia]